MDRQSAALRRNLLLLGGLLAVGGVLLWGLLTRVQPGEVEAPPAMGSDLKLLVRPHSPTEGPADAPVVIVEFFDPACETCGAFYPFVKEILAANEGRIRLVLRYAPFHQGSDKIVALLEAARMQDRFWPVLERLLATQAQWSPRHSPQIGLVWDLLTDLDLDVERVLLDMTSPEIARIIEQDLADAAALKVTRTPEFFVNGRPLPSFGYEQLQRLVDEELAAVRSR